MGSFVTAGTLQEKNKSNQPRNLVAMTINNAVLQSTMKCWNICHQLALYPRDTNPARPKHTGHLLMEQDPLHCRTVVELTNWYSTSGANQWAQY